MNDLNPDGLAEIVAIDEGQVPRKYPSEVKAIILRDDISTYDQAAAYINESEAEVVCLQHEYGLFGTHHPDQRYGEYLLPLLHKINKPIVTTLHTILEHPTPIHREVMREIADLSDIMVAMLSNAKERMENSYGINSERIVVINHGVTDRPRAKKIFKSRFGWENRRVLLMTGLLNPGKGVEYVIQALPDIVKRFPETLFVVVGETHPEVKKIAQESYRESLIAMTKNLGVCEYVEFIDQYLPLNDLLEYYEACDIYLTPHLDPQQVASGTLAYALGMGKACISTKYIYAKEMLHHGRGVLVDFQNAPQIAEAVIDIFSDSSVQDTLERKAYSIGRTMSWPRAAERYLNLFRLVNHVGEKVAAEENLLSSYSLAKSYRESAHSTSPATTPSPTTTSPGNKQLRRSER